MNESLRDLQVCLSTVKSVGDPTIDGLVEQLRAVLDETLGGDSRPVEAKETDSLESLLQDRDRLAVLRYVMSPGRGELERANPADYASFLEAQKYLLSAPGFFKRLFDRKASEKHSQAVEVRSPEGLSEMQFDLERVHFFRLFEASTSREEREILASVLLRFYKACENRSSLVNRADMCRCIPTVSAYLPPEMPTAEDKHQVCENWLKWAQEQLVYEAQIEKVEAKDLDVKLSSVEAALIDHFYAGREDIRGAKEMFGSRFEGPLERELGRETSEGVKQLTQTRFETLGGMPSGFPTRDQLEKGRQAGAYLCLVRLDSGKKPCWIMADSKPLMECFEKDFFDQTRAVRDFLFESGFLSPEDLEACSDEVLARIRTTYASDPQRALNEVLELKAVKGFMSSEEVKVLYSACVEAVQHFGHAFHSDPQRESSELKRRGYVFGAGAYIVATRTPSSEVALTGSDIENKKDGIVSVGYLSMRGLPITFRRPTEVHTRDWYAFYPTLVYPVLGRWL